MDTPTQRDWLKLYEAAMAFKELAQWRWMSDSDVFAVQNPSKDEVGYCSLMGAAGEEFGLLVFLGAEGFESYKQIALGDVDCTSLDVWAMISALSMALLGRDELDRQDHDVIRSLGLRFRGKNAWPCFRSHRPGYLPWGLESEEAHLLTAALEQAIDVAARVRDGALGLQRGASAGLVLTRYCCDGHWMEEWRKPLALRPGPAAPALPDRAYLQRLREMAGSLRGSWELDLFFMPTPVASGSERPFYPTCVMALERTSGFIVGGDITRPALTAEEKQGAVLQLLQKAGELPREIRVASDELRRIVGPLATGLGISVRVARLPMLEKARTGLMKHMVGLD